MPLPHFIPADLKLIRDAFDHEDFIYELKMDGFRALAHIVADETRLVSRKGNVFKSFPAWLPRSTSTSIVKPCSTVRSSFSIQMVARNSTNCSRGVDAASQCSMRSICSAWMVRIFVRVR